MRAYTVNEGTLRKPQGPCYASAMFLQLKEVHLFPVKSNRVTVTSEYVWGNAEHQRRRRVTSNQSPSKGSLHPREDLKLLLLLDFYNYTLHLL